MDVAVVSLRIFLVSVQRNTNNVSHGLSWAMTAFNKWLNIQTVYLYGKCFRVEIQSALWISDWNQIFWEEKQTSGREGHPHPDLDLELKCWDTAASFSATTALLPVMQQAEVPFRQYCYLFVFMNVSEFTSEKEGYVQLAWISQESLWSSRQEGNRHVNYSCPLEKWC